MTDSPGALFQRLLDVMKRLREPGGCPWDREQTTSSLKPFLIEEAYEVLEAIESGGSAAVREELGDLLFQVVFHARIAEERGVSQATVIREAIDRLVGEKPPRMRSIGAGHSGGGSVAESIDEWMKDFGEWRSSSTRQRSTR